jgi:phosphoribosyl-dephospho-CoA transferase
MDTPRIALAPRLVLFGVPSRAFMACTTSSNQCAQMQHHSVRGFSNAAAAAVAAQATKP